MSKPIWFLNLCALTDWNDGESAIFACSYWSKTINEWLDETKVLGNKSALSVCRVLKKLYSRHCNFLVLESESFKEVKKVVRRLNGLAHV